MQVSEACHFIHRGEHRKSVLQSLIQPLSAKQLAHRTGLSFDRCRDVVRKLRSAGLVRCLNPDARRSRVYWPTELGLACLAALENSKRPQSNLSDTPKVDWTLFGWVCYSHRAAVLKALTTPLQPAAIKRRARSQNPKIRMSANNVRDVIRLFVAKGIVRPVKQRKRAFPAYGPTETGQVLRELLLSAEVPA